MGEYVRIDESTHKLLKVEAAKRGSTMGDLVRAAVAGFGQSPDCAQLTDAERAWVERLLFVLRSGHAKAIKAIKSSLETLVDTVELTRERTQR